jgi:hypothetical protein
MFLEEFPINRFFNIAFLIALVSSSGCCRHLRNLDEFPINKEDMKSLACLRDAGTNVWFLIDSMNNMHVLRNQPDVLSDICEIQLSPDISYCAVISAGEGHPVLSIFAVDFLLSGSTTDSTVAAYRVIDPYPGTIAAIRWLDRTRISFKSDMDFTKFNPETYRTATEPSDTQTIWEYDVKSGKFKIP